MKPDFPISHAVPLYEYVKLDYQTAVVYYYFRPGGQHRQKKPILYTRYMQIESVLSEKWKLRNNVT